MSVDLIDKVQKIARKTYIKILVRDFGFWSAVHQS